MWPCEHDGQIMLLVEFHHPLGSVIGSIVEQDNVMFPPISIPLIHDFDEAAKEELHDRRVRVGLQD